MTVMAVDTSASALNRISEIVAERMPEAEILLFDNSPAALAKAREVEIDIAFLETELPELNGLDLGQYLKELYPMINLIYLTDSVDYGYAAMALHASGYLLKPAQATGVERELNDLRYPEVQKNYKRAFAQTFGNFELFADGVPVPFKYSRTKEVVALLINNRGAQTTNGEIIAALWEDDGDPDKKASYLGNLRQDLQNTLKRLKLTDLIVKRRGSLAIAVNRIECDLYDWLENKGASKYSYLGEYMNQYSWAESVHAELEEISGAMEGESY